MNWFSSTLFIKNRLSHMVADLFMTLGMQSHQKAKKCVFLTVWPLKKSLIIEKKENNLCTWLLVPPRGKVKMCVTLSMCLCDMLLITFKEGESKTWLCGDLWSFLVLTVQGAVPVSHCCISSQGSLCGRLTRFCAEHGYESG